MTDNDIRNLMVCVYPSCQDGGTGAASTLVTEKNNLMLQKGVVKKFISVAPKNSYQNFISMYYKTSWAVSKPTVQTNQKDWSCADDASPARLWYWVIGGCPGTATTANIELTF